MIRLAALARLALVVHEDHGVAEDRRVELATVVDAVSLFVGAVGWHRDRLVVGEIGDRAKSGVELAGKELVEGLPAAGAVRP